MYIWGYCEHGRLGVGRYVCGTYISVRVYVCIYLREREREGVCVCVCGASIFGAMASMAGLV